MTRNILTGIVLGVIFFVLFCGIPTDNGMVFGYFWKAALAWAN